MSLSVACCSDLQQRSAGVTHAMALINPLIDRIFKHAPIHSI